MKFPRSLHAMVSTNNQRTTPRAMGRRLAPAVGGHDHSVAQCALFPSGTPPNGQHLGVMELHVRQGALLLRELAAHEVSVAHRYLGAGVPEDDAQLFQRPAGRDEAAAVGVPSALVPRQARRPSALACSYAASRAASMFERGAKWHC